MTVALAAVAGRDAFLVTRRRGPTVTRRLPRPARAPSVRRATARSAASARPTSGRPAGAPATGSRFSPRGRCARAQGRRRPSRGRRTRPAGGSRPRGRRSASRTATSVKRSAGSARAPVVHQPLVLTIEERQVAAIPGIVLARREVGEEDRQAGVDRVPTAMNDARVRESQPDQPEQLEIPRAACRSPAAPRVRFGAARRDSPRPPCTAAPR